MALRRTPVMDVREEYGGGSDPMAGNFCPELE